MEYDVVIIGGGPSGLSTAIKLKQLDPNLNVCILEKASEIGAHILSGNVFETRAIDELLPNWGAICYTPDGNPIVGPAWGLKNFWINEGHSFGITAAGGAGWQLAEWIVNICIFRKKKT